MDGRYLPETREGKLARLSEEIGEVMAAAGTVLHVLGKIHRHGWQSTDPHTDIEYNNQQILVDMLPPLARELPDLAHAIQEVLSILRDQDGALIDMHPGSRQQA